jgi:hypothetical protein
MNKKELERLLKVLEPKQNNMRSILFLFFWFILNIGIMLLNISLGLRIIIISIVNIFIILTGIE